MSLFYLVWVSHGAFQSQSTPIKINLVGSNWLPSTACAMEAIEIKELDEPQIAVVSADLGATFETELRWCTTACNYSKCSNPAAYHVQ